MSEAEISVTGPQLLARGVVFLIGFCLVAGVLPAWFIWANQGRIAFVYPAAFLTWTGYLLAHYGAEGVFVDDVSDPSEEASDAATQDDEATDNEDDSQVFHRVVPEHPLHAIGIVLGIGINIAGIALGVWVLRHENILLGIVAGGLFFGGYVFAHYFESGKLL